MNTPAKLGAYALGLAVVFGAAPGPQIVFYAEAPSRGDYRLFLDFKHSGKVRTADFTLSTGQAAPATTRPTAEPSAKSTVEPAPTPAASGGHGDNDH